MKATLLLALLILQGLFTNISAGGFEDRVLQPSTKKPIPTETGTLVLSPAPIPGVVALNNKEVTVAAYSARTLIQNVTAGGTITLMLDIASGNTTFEQEGWWLDIHDIKLRDKNGTVIAHGDTIVPVAGRVFGRVVFVCNGTYVFDVKNPTTLFVTAKLSKNFKHKQSITTILHKDSIKEFPGTWNGTDAKIVVDSRDGQGMIRHTIKINAPWTVYPEIRLDWDHDSTYLDGDKIPVFWNTLNAPRNAIVLIEMVYLVDRTEGFSYEVARLDAKNGSLNFLARVVRESGEQYKVRVSLYDGATKLSQSESPAFTLNIAPDDVRHISVLSPTSETVTTPGSTIDIRWNTENIPLDASIELAYRSTTQDRELGSAHIATVANRGSYRWSLPEKLAPGSYTISVSHVNEYGFIGISATSGDFKIVAPQPLVFTRDLALGMSGNDVQFLQRILNSHPATRVAGGGPGAPGQETTYFGSSTQSGLIKWQTMAGIPATGIVDALTRAKFNTLDLSQYISKSPFTMNSSTISATQNAYGSYIQAKIIVSVTAGDKDIDISMNQGGQLPGEFTIFRDGAPVGTLDTAGVSYFENTLVVGDEVTRAVITVEAGRTQQIQMHVAFLSKNGAHLPAGEYSLQLTKLHWSDGGVKMTATLPNTPTWFTGMATIKPTP